VGKVKVISFTVGRDSGWSAVTPAGLVQADRKQQVTIVISESWESGLHAICEFRKSEHYEGEDE
jgi:hypothetical protein